MQQYKYGVLYGMVGACAKWESTCIVFMYDSFLPTFVTFNVLAVVQSWGEGGHSMSGTNVSDGNCSIDSYLEALILQVSLAVSGAVVCAVAIILAAILKLHKQLIYRLAMYQVSSSLAFGLSSIFDIIQLPILLHGESHDVCLPLCLAAAFVSTYTLLVRLAFTVIMTCHIFVFAVCYKNMKRLEVCYVVAALTVPALMAGVPFLTSTYGPQGRGQPWCWIQLDDTSCPPRPLRAGTIEMFGLYFGPVFVGLAAMSLLIVVMISVLAYRTFRRQQDALKNKVLIQQTSALMAYPVLYCLILAIPISHNAYDTLVPGEHRGDVIWDYVDEVASGGAILTAGLALLIHIIVLRVKGSKRFAARQTDHSLSSENSALLNSSARSSTYYSLPSDT